MTRSRVLGLAAILIVLGWVVFSYRLAFTSDRTIASQIREAIGQPRSVDEVRRVLERRYRHVSSAAGSGYFRMGARVASQGLSLTAFDFVVGRYHLPFETTVEAEVVVDANGSVRDVSVRRTTD